MPVICRFRKLFLFSFFIFLSSCNSHHHTEKEIVSAMHHHDELILRLNADSIALLYTPDGNLGDIAIGRDSIRKFLSSFKNIRVLSQASMQESIIINHDTALQKGSYLQRDIIAGKDTVTVAGEYTARWEWTREGWLIKKMTTKPDK